MLSWWFRQRGGREQQFRKLDVFLPSLVGMRLEQSGIDEFLVEIRPIYLGDAGGLPMVHIRLKMKMPKLPMPLNHGRFDVEPFAAYMARWPARYAGVPEAVIETWIYRHWQQFQQWLPLHPLTWDYELTTMTNEEITSISHVKDWPKVLGYWGDDLLDGPSRKNTWLGRYMLANGTTPTPIIVARDAAAWTHPREGVKMIGPNQLVEGHMRLAYLQAMIRRDHENLCASHALVVARLPPTPVLQGRPQ